MTQDAPVICLSCGDPAGIGPEITARLAQRDYAAKLVAVADRQVLEQAAVAAGVAVDFYAVSSVQEVGRHTPGRLAVLHHPVAVAPVFGIPQPANAEYILSCLTTCVDLCQQQHAAAMVTGPVNKAVINDSGRAFCGHTEWLAERCGGYPVMMLTCEPLRVCLATTHLPLHQVARQITAERLTRVLQTMHRDFARFYGLARPALGVCGLNPHAGEGGHLGTEEIRIIAPTLATLRADGIDCRGPLPADTLFTPTHLDEFDGVLAMYHDQGLPVIKHRGFGGVVNVTLGLPIIRTSVDHGTAMDIAGTGKGSDTSLHAAVELALRFANNRAGL